MSLPTSFATNTMDRMVDFLNESNRIESIDKIDYRHQRYQTVAQGHFGALVQSQHSAVNQEPLTIRKIREWQGLLTREQLTVGEHIDEEAIGRTRSEFLPRNVRIGKHIPPDYSRVPTLLDHLVEKINERVKDQEKLKNDVEYCTFLGESFQEFECIHPFVDGNGRTGRLLANYINTYCQRPLMVFNSEMRERNEYYRAHVSSKEMSRFMAKKVQEVIFSLDQTLLFRSDKGIGGTGLYVSSDKMTKEFYEWHVLNPLLYEEESVQKQSDSSQSIKNTLNCPLNSYHRNFRKLT